MTRQFFSRIWLVLVIGAVLVGGRPATASTVGHKVRATGHRIAKTTTVDSELSHPPRSCRHATRPLP